MPHAFCCLDFDRIRLVRVIPRNNGLPARDALYALAVQARDSQFFAPIHAAGASPAHYFVTRFRIDSVENGPSPFEFAKGSRPCNATPQARFVGERASCRTEDLTRVECALTQKVGRGCQPILAVQLLRFPSALGAGAIMASFCGCVSMYVQALCLGRRCAQS